MTSKVNGRLINYTHLDGDGYNMSKPGHFTACGPYPSFWISLSGLQQRGEGRSMAAPPITVPVSYMATWENELPTPHLSNFPICSLFTFCQGHSHPPRLGEEDTLCSWERKPKADSNIQWWGWSLGYKGGKVSTQLIFVLYSKNKF